MSDFGELCPLFNTGVFNETTFPAIKMTDISVGGNALAMGTLTIANAATCGGFTFGRTVVVTGAFIRRTSAVAGLMFYLLNHRTSVLAAGTEFASIQVSTTVSCMEVYTWVPMTVTEKTFTSNEVLGFTLATATNANGGIIDLMIRYKEK